MIPKIIEHNKVHIAILVLTIALAAFLRLWNLSSHAIFFGDAARDVLVAQESLETGTIPLVGIPSSVPRFHQGPLSIWIIMFAQSLFGPNLYPTSLVFAILSLIALIAIYELLSITTSKEAGLIAVIMLAASPLAVAHARMPYHTTPIPLILILFIASLLSLKKKTWYPPLLVGLSFSIIFLFERNLLPLLVLVPLAWYLTKRSWNIKDMFSFSSGVVIGIFPLLVYDLSHKFMQTFGFLAWTIFRAGTFFTGSRTGLESIQAFLLTSQTHLSRIFFVNSSIPLYLFFAGTTLAIIKKLKISKKIKFKQLLKNIENKLSHLEILSMTGIIILLLSFSIHGSLGEAYFPAFLVFIPILIASLISQMKRKIRLIFMGILILLMISNAILITRYSFFIGNNDTYTYGASTSELQQIALFINEKNFKNISLKTDHEAGIYETYFDNLRFFLKLQGIEDTENGRSVIINPSKMTTVTTLKNSKTFETLRVYW